MRPRRPWRPPSARPAATELAQKGSGGLKVNVELVRATWPEPGQHCGFAGPGGYSSLSYAACCLAAASSDLATGLPCAMLSLCLWSSCSQVEPPVGSTGPWVGPTGQPLSSLSAHSRAHRPPEQFNLPPGVARTDPHQINSTQAPAHDRQPSPTCPGRPWPARTPVGSRRPPPPEPDSSAGLRPANAARAIDDRRSRGWDTEAICPAPASSGGEGWAG
jgi:hypothetical protein